MPAGCCCSGTGRRTGGQRDRQTANIECKCEIQIKFNTKLMWEKRVSSSSKKRKKNNKVNTTVISVRTDACVWASASVCVCVRMCMLGKVNGPGTTKRWQISLCVKCKACVCVWSAKSIPGTMGLCLRCSYALIECNLNALSHHSACSRSQAAWCCCCCSCCSASAFVTVFC